LDAAPTKRIVNYVPARESYEAIRQTSVIYAKLHANLGHMTRIG